LLVVLKNSFGMLPTQERCENSLETLKDQGVNGTLWCPAC